jgi:hypothetical protein
MQTKHSVKVESKVGSLLNRLIEISWFYASITFLQCNIHTVYGCMTIRDSPRNFINACLLAATARNLFQSGIGRPSMKLSHFRTYNVSCRIGPCIRNTWIKQILKPINGRQRLLRNWQNINSNNCKFPLCHTRIAMYRFLLIMCRSPVIN